LGTLLAMITWFRQKLEARRQARRERLAHEYGAYSNEERLELDRLRSEHDPLDELARTRSPGSANVGRWNESDR
jgi:hypothetical protein